MSGAKRKRWHLKFKLELVEEDKIANLKKVRWLKCLAGESPRLETVRATRAKDSGMMRTKTGTTTSSS